MIDLPYDSPHFDVAGELLCTLSPRPRRMKAIARDFGFDDVGRMLHLRSELERVRRVYGIRVIVERGKWGQGWVARIDPRHWRSATVEGLHYWGKVNTETEAAA